MSAAKNEFFTLIRVPSEKKKIFSDLVKSQSEIIMKGTSDNLYRLIPKKISDGQWLCCDYESGSVEIDSNSNTSEIHCANFSVGPERYFFQSNVQVSKASVLLETQVDLYHLQRRKTMRVALPEELKALCNITNHNDRFGITPCKIVDFSTGGVKLLYESTSPGFQSGDRLALVLRLGSRRPFEVTAEVRHVAINDDKQLFGVQFITSDRILINKLMALQMDLQAEIFRKWKQHQW